MPSLIERKKLVGFFSYSRRDDEHSQGALSRLRAQIHNELRLQLGFDFHLWQDTTSIPDGAQWEVDIKRAISEAVFFIPIVTPSLVASKHCRTEFEAFLDREDELGKHNLVFPLLYVRVPALEKEEQWQQDRLLEIIGRRQYFDWQRFRHRSFSESDIAEKIEQYCRNIVESLQQPWVSAEERRAAEAAEEQRIEDEARMDREEKARQQAEAEARRKADEERRDRLKQQGGASPQPAKKPLANKIGLIGLMVFAFCGIAVPIYLVSVLRPAPVAEKSAVRPVEVPGCISWYTKAGSPVATGVMILFDDNAGAEAAAQSAVTKAQRNGFSIVKYARRGSDDVDGSSLLGQFKDTTVAPDVVVFCGNANPAFTNALKTSRIFQ